MQRNRHEKVYFSPDKKKLTWLESHLTIGANHLTFADLPPTHTLMRVLHLGQWGRGEKTRKRTRFEAVAARAPVTERKAAAVPGQPQPLPAPGRISFHSTAQPAAPRAEQLRPRPGIAPAPRCGEGERGSGGQEDPSVHPSVHPCVPPAHTGPPTPHWGEQLRHQGQKS